MNYGPTPFMKCFHETYFLTGIVSEPRDGNLSYMTVGQLIRAPTLF